MLVLLIWSAGHAISFVLSILSSIDCRTTSEHNEWHKNNPVYRPGGYHSTAKRQCTWCTATLSMHPITHALPRTSTSLIEPDFAVDVTELLWLVVVGAGKRGVVVVASDVVVLQYMNPPTRPLNIQWKLFRNLKPQIQWTREQSILRMRRRIGANCSRRSPAL